MTEFRYSDTARKLDDSIVEDAKTSQKGEGDVVETKEDSGLSRIGKTALDELHGIQAARQAKTAEQEVAEHRIREKLAEIKSRGQRAVEDFLVGAKDKA